MIIYHNSLKFLFSLYAFIHNWLSTKSAFQSDVIVDMNSKYLDHILIFSSLPLVDVFKPGDPADEETVSHHCCDSHCSVLTGKCDLGIIEDRCITFSVELEMHVFISNIV